MLSIEQKKFINNYIKQRKTIKKTLPILLIATFAIRIGGGQAQSTKNKPDIQHNGIQTQIIKSAIDKFFTIEKGDNIETKILQGPISISEQAIQSNNNLIVREGWVLPRNSAIVNTEILKNKQYFNREYDIDTLRIQINGLINMSANQSMHKHKNNTIQSDSFHTEFTLQCIDKSVHSPLCNRNIRHFLDTFYTFDLRDHVSELEKIAKKLRKQEHRDIFCKNLLRHIQYNQAFNNNREKTLDGCDQTTKNQYKIGSEFFNINNEFINNNFTATVYEDKDLNTYKIMSLAQIVMHDAQNGSPNNRRIEAYINQMQALLRKPIIEPIYWDIQYRIINNHIIPQLSEQTARGGNFNQIRTQLLGLNRDNSLLQYSGLHNTITNTGLIARIQETNIQQIALDPENIIEGLRSLPYLQIKNTEIEGDIVQIEGDLKIIDALDSASVTTFTATGKIELNRLLITEIQLPKYLLFTQILNTFIQSRNTTLPALYSYINENIALYQNQTHQDICQELEQITTFSINICNPGLIQGQQKRGNTTVDYKINIENNIIQEIQTSDINLSKYLQNIYLGRATDSIRIAGILKEIILAQPQDKQDESIINENIIQVANTFQSFFRIPATDIAYIQDTYYIEFNINSITFVIAYNLQNNILGPLFFKNVLVNNRPIRTQKWNINPEPENTSLIQKFTSDPLAFIQEIDPFTYEIYQQFKIQ